jgi:hypothetical protein
MGSSGAWIYFRIFSDQIFLRFSMKRTFCYSHSGDSTSFIKRLSVFYPHILIICIYYIPGMNNRALKCCAIFNRMFEKVGGRSNRLLSCFRECKVCLLRRILNIKYILICLTLFVIAWLHVCYFIDKCKIVLKKYLKKTWMSRCPNFWLVLFILEWSTTQRTSSQHDNSGKHGSASL